MEFAINLVIMAHRGLGLVVFYVASKGNEKRGVAYRAIELEKEGKRISTGNCE